MRTLLAMAPLGRTDAAGDQTSLYDVTFVVLDVETTGATPGAASLTEIGAATYRGGELLGTFDSLVQPDCALPPFITELTGITDGMLVGAPTPRVVLPQLVDFVGAAVIVGHNVAFDLAFLDGALAGCGRPPLRNASVDTLALARRMVRDLVPDCALATLAAMLHLEHRPRHRALADALATADLLHKLLEQAAGFGVERLGELLALPERLAPLPRPSAGVGFPVAS